MNRSLLLLARTFLALACLLNIHGAQADPTLDTLCTLSASTSKLAVPSGPLILGQDGAFYDTTVYGGSLDAGTVFKITSSGVPTLLYSFTEGNDGLHPAGGLVLGNDGAFYGTTSGGPVGQNYGTVFRITTDGLLTTLYRFTGGYDGATPQAGLIQGRDGAFYGTTERGGASGFGTVFRITTDGTLTVLYSFALDSNGGNPQAGLIQASDGALYGTTAQGGFKSAGTVFRITTAKVFTTLYAFTGADDGSYPHGTLIQGPDGALYGTTLSGGIFEENGTVFKISPSGSLTTLHSCTNGLNIPSRLVQGRDGAFYTTSASGGGNGAGTVFKVTASGKVTTLYTFAGTDGAEPFSGLIAGTDDDFYGTTFAGGANNAGSVFRITRSGTFTTLYSFVGGSGGANPVAAVVQGSDGAFYGTTAGGGAYGYGTVFRLTSSGTLTTLYSFSGGSDGAAPMAALVQGKDGALYGTTLNGGVAVAGITAGAGTVFRITTAGAFTSLHAFIGSDGAKPLAALVQGGGALSGTTVAGGANNGGTVFKITAKGVLTTLHSFQGSDGDAPAAALVQGRDGAFYGTTSSGNTSAGTVFRITPAGVLTTVYFIDYSSGIYPITPVTVGRDGNFYGTTEVGGIGANAAGTVFRVNVIPRIDSFTPTSGVAGTSVTITGNNFTGTKRMLFGSASASFKIVSDSSLMAIVPSGATTGRIAVTNSFGKGVSATNYIVP